eukprot:905219-Amphidinium_carterae.1
MVHCAMYGFLRQRPGNLGRHAGRYQLLRGRERDGLDTRALKDCGYVVAQCTAVDGSRPHGFTRSSKARAKVQWSKRLFLMLLNEGVELCNAIKVEQQEGASFAYFVVHGALGRLRGLVEPFSVRARCPTTNLQPIKTTGKVASA